MRLEQCSCGEKLLLSEEPNKILHHLKHQKKCLYSYIGCVSYALFFNGFKVKPELLFGLTLPERSTVLYMAEQQLACLL